MATDYQKIIVLGNTIGEAKVKRAKDSGAVYADFTVACSGRKGGQTVFYPVRVFGKAAEACKSIKKGDRILVEGSLEVSEYTDAGGQERRAYRILATAYRWLEKSGGQGQGRGRK